jgi:hypothetical protein
VISYSLFKTDQMKPSKFRYSETSYFGYTLNLELTEAGFRYQYSDGPFPTIVWKSVEVEADFWTIFHHIMMAQPKWKRNYHQVDVCDGVNWELELVYPDRTFKSKGYQSWPAGFDDFHGCLGLLGVKELLDDD